MLIKIFANEFVYRVKGHWANLLLKRGVIFLTKSYSGILFHAHRTTQFFILLNAHKSSENLSRKHAFSRDHLLDRWDEVHYWHNDANSVVVSHFYWPWSMVMLYDMVIWLHKSLLVQMNFAIYHFHGIAYSALHLGCLYRMDRVKLAQSVCALW